MKADRNAAVTAAVDDIARIMETGIRVDTLERAKSTLLGLCAQHHLFPRDEFPLPVDGQCERTFLIHQRDSGAYAMYVNVGMPGQAYRPHDHGGTWAIVAAVHGVERHRLYIRNHSVAADRDGHTSCAPTDSPLRLATQIDVRPGVAVSLLPEGIHDIQALGDEPLLHLHLYGLGFEHQAMRTEFDLDRGSVHRFKLTDLGYIEDAR